MRRRRCPSTTRWAGTSSCVVESSAAVVVVGVRFEPLERGASHVRVVSGASRAPPRLFQGAARAAGRLAVAVELRPRVPQLALELAHPPRGLLFGHRAGVVRDDRSVFLVALSLCFPLRL